MQTLASRTGWIEREINYLSEERRARPRYELHLPLQYQLLAGNGELAGSGRTRNLSSSGIAFEVEGELQIGAYVELAIQWPVALDGNVPLKLVVRGEVVWHAAGWAAIRTTRCEFRTQRKAAASGSLTLA